MKNILLLVIDGLKPKNLGCCGYARNTSPAIDSIAKNGAIFENAFVNSSWTKPNIVSIISGLNPSTHRVLTVEDKISDSIKTLPEILKEQGFKTALFSGLRHPDKNHGFRGFDKHRIFEEIPVQFRTADKINKELIQWIEENKNSNFFIYAHYVDTHLPFTPPAPFNTAFLKEPYTHKDPIGSKVTEEELEKLTALYDSEILYLDSQIKELKKKLEEMNLLEETLIIITSDHGFEFMEHGNFGLLKFLHEENIRVPLIISGKEIPKNKRIALQASVTDLAPTILEIFGINYGKKFDGKSLLPAMNGKKETEGEIFLETQENSHQPYCSYTLTRGVRTKKWKYLLTEQKFKFELRPKLFKKGSYWLNNFSYLAQGIKNMIEWNLNASTEELYDLENDPQERKNISRNEPETINKLREIFSSYFGGK